MQAKSLHSVVIAVTAVVLFGAAADRCAAGPYNLDDYTLVTHIPLLASPGSNPVDFSGIAYSNVTSTLFIINNGDSNIYEYGVDGTYLRRITTTGFTDSEDIVHMGGTKFAIVEEGNKAISMFDILPATVSLTKAGSTTINPSGISGGSLGNSGLEGLAYNSSANVFYALKEISSRQTWQVAIPGGVSTNLSAITTALTTGGDTLTDFSGAYFDNGPGGNLYVISHESGKIAEVTLGGVLVNTRLQPGAQVEGITFSPDMKNMFVIGEDREYYHYSVPEPSSIVLGLMAGAACLLFGRRAARRKA